MTLGKLLTVPKPSIPHLENETKARDLLTKRTALERRQQSAAQRQAIPSWFSAARLLGRELLPLPFEVPHGTRRVLVRCYCVRVITVPKFFRKPAAV